MIYKNPLRYLQSIYRQFLPLTQTVGGVIDDRQSVEMAYSTLGRTNLKISVMSLGCGGHSRLGLRSGKSKKEVKVLIKRALDLGINCIDTANDYGTELFIGNFIQDIPRDKLILSSKIRSRNLFKQQISEKMLTKSLEKSLRDLQTDYIDIYHLASVSPQDYSYVQQELIPCLQKHQQAGKIRYLGITEQFNRDTSHQMLQLALKDDCWDVMMVGFNLFNQSARDLVFPLTQDKNIGVMVMYAVRKALKSAEQFQEAVKTLQESGNLTTDKTTQEILGELLGNSHQTIQDIAYRYCRHQQGVNTVLSGTGSLTHLEENILSLNRPCLPSNKLETIEDLFRNVKDFSGN